MKMITDDDKNSDKCSRCEEMHRRAQQAESEALAVPRRFEGTLLDMANRLSRTKYKVRHWKQRYYSEVKKIRESGLVDTKHPDSEFQTGYLPILVDRLINRIKELSGKISNDKLNKVIIAANNSLFETSFYCDKEQLNHEIHFHPDKLPEILRMLAKSQREAMAAIQEVIQEMVGG